MYRLVGELLARPHTDRALHSRLLGRHRIRAQTWCGVLVALVGVFGWMSLLLLFRVLVTGFEDVVQVRFAAGDGDGDEGFYGFSESPSG